MTPSPSDPSQLLQKTVKIHSITTKVELNGQIGTVREYNSATNRYYVELSQVSAATTGRNNTNTNSVSLKADNLRIATYTDRIQFKIQSTKEILQLLYRDENIREQLRRTYTRIDQALPPNIKPEHVIFGIFLLYIWLSTKIGWTKTFFLFSILSIFPVMSLPDIMNGSSVSRIIENFPNRFREQLVQMTGYPQISNRIAMGVLVALLLFSGKLLVTPTRRADNTNFKTYDYEGDTSMPMTHPNTISDNKFTMEEIYKLGFEDASQSNEYGTSLPPAADSFFFSSKKTSTSAMRNTDYSYDNMDDYIIPPKKQRPKTRLGMGTILSLMAIGRTVKEMGFTAEGRFDLNLLIVNLRRMEPWRLGLLGLSVYRLISAFLL
jgi:hypothetical protein